MTASARDQIRLPRALLGLLAALSFGLVAGCGPSTASLAELALEAETYDGHEVTTHGVIAEFDEDDGALERHFVLRDAEDNRVLLQPDETAEEHVGSPVSVTGEFEFDAERGRVLHVETIEATEPRS